MLRYGFVLEVDYKKGRVLVEFPGMENPILLSVVTPLSGENKIYGMPGVGDHVACLLETRGNQIIQSGVVIGSLFSPINKVPANSEKGDYSVYFKDETSLKYNAENHSLVGKLNGDADLSIDAPEHVFIKKSAGKTGKPEVRKSFEKNISQKTFEIGKNYTGTLSKEGILKEISEAPLLSREDSGDLYSKKSNFYASIIKNKSIISNKIYEAINSFTGYISKKSLSILSTDEKENIVFTPKHTNIHKGDTINYQKGTALWDIDGDLSINLGSSNENKKAMERGSSTLEAYIGKENCYKSATSDKGSGNLTLKTEDLTVKTEGSLLKTVEKSLSIKIKESLSLVIGDDDNVTKIEITADSVKISTKGTFILERPQEKKAIELNTKGQIIINENLEIDQ